MIGKHKTFEGPVVHSTLRPLCEVDSKEQHAKGSTRIENWTMAL